jgi:peptidoglycan/xylan/chitin deacetylase (PgdA/CDA1 family)
MAGRRVRGVLAVAALALCLGIGAVARASEPTRSDGGVVVGAGDEPVGCTSRPGAVYSHGPEPARSRPRRSGSAPGPAGPREVALTFDDGPSETQTPAILATLDRLGARATFFEEGRHVAGREALMRQILASGDEIGNHSFHHPRDPGAAELARTDEAIRDATGFEPCLFRPPYGLVDAKDRAAARAEGLQLVLWSLDSGDDIHRAVAAIRATAVTEAKPGAIVLMHDGGHHPQTVRALPSVIRGLHARGIRLVTVTELLGGRFLYAPR